MYLWCKNASQKLLFKSLSQFICFQSKWCEQVEFTVLMVKLER